MSVVDKISLPPPLPRRSATVMTPGRKATELQGGPSVAQVGTAEPDALEQLRKLGELCGAGVQTEAECDVKKAELLRRI
jgi:hypothetical protein